MPAKDTTHPRSHTRMVRVSSYSVAGVLTLLMASATLPPILADQSDRAVVNAPISLLTAPIAGEVTELGVRVGQRLDPGAVVAAIHNARIDRSTLITLDGKVEETTGSLVAARSKRQSDETYVAALDAEIRKQAEQMVARLQGEAAEARARVSAAEAEGLSTQAVVDRQRSMVNRDVASVDLLRPTQHKLEAARFDKEAETAKLNQKLAQIEAVKKGVYVGNEFNGLAVLSQKRRDLSFDAQRLGIEESQLSAALTAQRALQATEGARLASLTDARLRAPQGGVVLSTGAAPGRHVSAGDSIATLVDCNQAFVVAIFSYRQAKDLAVGTRVSVEGGGMPARKGSVTEILPKTSDRTDERYAVPFPQTERREMYVLVSLDDPSGDRTLASSPAAARTSPCSVGQWVTVTRENGWLPSASVAWRNVAEAASPANAGRAWDGAVTAARHAYGHARSGISSLVSMVTSAPAEAHGAGDTADAGAPGRRDEP